LGLLRLTIPAALGGMVLLTGVAFTTNVRAETTKETDTTTTRKTTKAAKDKHAEDREKTGTPGAAVPADNTGTNKRDRADSAKTADQAKNNKSDVELTAEIRRAVVDDKALSTNAHNVKIIVQDGRVTLKGPVASKSEQAAVAKKAADIVGRAKVTDEMAVAP
jgi:osmotically-inducible protein OsmY